MKTFFKVVALPGNRQKFEAPFVYLHVAGIKSKCHGRIAAYIYTRVSDEVALFTIRFSDVKLKK